MDLSDGHQHCDGGDRHYRRTAIATRRIWPHDVRVRVFVGEYDCWSTNTRFLYPRACRRGGKSSSERTRFT